MSPHIHVSSAPKGTEEKNRSVLPAFVSISPLFHGLCFCCSFAYLAFLVEIESFQGSGPERVNLPASPEDITSLSHTLLTTAFTVSCSKFC